ncbi:phosphoenolpyruvate carboxylase, partial [Nocardia wallacei]|uniref:phosphoenolpyruvate carboxylase n=1 Tax=Nocardia wallacei TaxID=480035 RepID=UPI0024587E3F
VHTGDDAAAAVRAQALTAATLTAAEMVGATERPLEATLGWLSDLYRRWPFFRTVMSNLAQVMAKADLDIAARYAELVGARGGGPGA